MRKKDVATRWFIRSGIWHKMYRMARLWFQRFCIFTPNSLGKWYEIIQFDEHIFHLGWNHQLHGILDMYRFLLHTLLTCWYSKRGSYFRKQLCVFRDTPGLVSAFDKSKRSLFTLKGVKGPKFIWTLNHELQGETGMLTLKDFDFFGDFHTQKKTSGPSGCIFVLTSQAPLNPCYFLVTSKLSKQKLGRNLGLRKGCEGGNDDPICSETWLKNTFQLILSWRMPMISFGQRSGSKKLRNSLLPYWSIHWDA